MNDIIDMFTPYMFMLTFLITISLNLYAIFKGVNWVTVIILNIIVSVIFNIIGIGSFDLLTQIVTYLVDLIVSIFEGTIGAIFYKLGL